MSVLSRPARQTIKDHGTTVSAYALRFWPDAAGTWHGSPCGCPDDRCIGHHHEQGEPCPCLPGLLAQPAEPAAPTAEDHTEPPKGEHMPADSLTPRFIAARTHADELQALDDAATDLAAELAGQTLTTCHERAEETAYALRLELSALLSEANGYKEPQTQLQVTVCLHRLAGELTKQMHAAAARARAAGASWKEVGAATGVSLQRAQQRYRGL